MGLTVAITGPTGDIGRALLRQLDNAPEVDRVIGMARRPFNPSDMGLEKTEYRQGDILDENSITDLVDGADVLVHLAFLIVGGREETQRINLEGTSNVFGAATSAGLKRFIYTSSVAAYGFHEENPQPLTEEVAPKGTDDFYYSAQKAELERELHRMVDGSDLEAYVFRPCIVAGPGRADDDQRDDGAAAAGRPAAADHHLPQLDAVPEAGAAGSGHTLPAG